MTWKVVATKSFLMDKGKGSVFVDRDYQIEKGFESQICAEIVRDSWKIMKNDIVCEVVADEVDKVVKMDKIQQYTIIDINESYYTRLEETRFYIYKHPYSLVGHNTALFAINQLVIQKMISNGLSLEQVLKHFIDVYNVGVMKGIREGEKQGKEVIYLQISNLVKGVMKAGEINLVMESKDGKSISMG